MPRKKDKPEQIVTLLRQMEMEIANGRTNPQGCKETEITAPAYYRWRSESRGLKLNQARFGIKSESQVSFFRIQGRTYCGERVGEPNLTTYFYQEW